MNQSAIDATPSSQRIVSLDALRGFAILGILVMNIQGISMISAAYINPTAFGDLTGINRWVWIFSHIFFDQKFMTLFALLFGTGMLLFTDRLKAKNMGLEIHYRRIFWLLIIGLIHAYLFWYGDILVTYALCAFVVVLLRHLKPGIQFIIGLILIAIPSLLYGFWGLSWSYIPPEAQEDLQHGWGCTFRDMLLPGTSTAVE